jgi:hypothetical protein
MSPCPRCRGATFIDRSDGERYCLCCGWRTVSTDDGKRLPWLASIERNGVGYIPGTSQGRGWRKRGPRMRD